MIEVTRVTLIAPSLATRGSASSIAAAIHAAASKNPPVDLDEFSIADSAASFGLKKLTWANLKAAMFAGWGAILAVATAKGTPVDADGFAIHDSAASNATKRLRWQDLKATMFSSWGALVAASTGKPSPADADRMVLSDSAASNATKSFTIANLNTAMFSRLGPSIGAGATKASLADADMLVLSDSTAGAFSTKSITFLNALQSIYLRIGALIAGGPSKTSVVDADVFVVGDSAASFASKAVNLLAIKNAVSAGFGALIGGMTAKTTLVDADSFAISDSEASAASKRLLWVHLKAAIVTAWGALVVGLAGKATPDDADRLAISDSAASNATKSLTIGNLKTAIRTYLETLWLVPLDARLDVAEVEIDTLQFLDYPTFAGGGADTTVDVGGRLGDGIFLNINGVPRRGRPGALYISASVHAIVAVFGMGQSLSSAQANAGTAAILTSTPPNPTRELMFAGGTRPGGTGNPATPMPPVNVTAISPLVEGPAVIDAVYGETAGHGLLSQVLSSFESWRALLWGTFGFSGQLYDLTFGTAGQVGIRKGGTLFRNFERAVQIAYDTCFDNDVDFVVGAIPLDHGEADETTARAVYNADLIELQRDCASVCRKITGQGFDPLILLSQNSSFTESGSSTSTLAQFEVARDNPTTFVFSGPKYQLPYSDTRHLTSAGYRRLGEYHGLAWKRKRAGSVVATFPRTAVRVGAVITITCDVPVAPLVIDTSLVTDPGNYGVAYVQTGGTPRTISSVAIAGGNQVIVTLSGDPGSPTSEQVTFALNAATGAGGGGPTTGARCCIHDSTTTTGIDGTVLRSYMPHAYVNVTV